MINALMISAPKDVRTNKETHRSIACKSFIVEIFSKLYLEAATKMCSLKLVFLKYWQQKQLFSRIAICKEHLSLAATVYFLGVLNQNL